MGKGRGNGGRGRGLYCRNVEKSGREDSLAVGGWGEHGDNTDRIEPIVMLHKVSANEVAAVEN